MKTSFPSFANRSWAEKAAVLSGIVSLLIGAAHVAAFAAAESAVWSGPIGFRKPAMFGFSIGMTLLSIGWMLRYFPSRPRFHSAVLGTMSTSLLLEVFIISLQRFRGVPSHFNMATRVDGVLWTMMGAAIVAFAILAAVLAIHSFRRLDGPPALQTAIRAALLLLVFSQISGQLIVINGTAAVLPNDEFVAANISRTATFGAAGNLKLPHAIALHGLQVLPLLGVLIARLNLRQRNARRWIILSAAGFLGLAATTQVQAYTGRAITDLDLLMGSALVLSLSLWLMPWVYAIIRALVGAAESRSPTALRSRAHLIPTSELDAQTQTSKTFLSSWRPASGAHRRRFESAAQRRTARADVAPGGPRSPGESGRTVSTL